MATKELSAGSPVSASLDSSPGRPADTASTSSRADRKALGFGAMIVGLACVYLVGFAPMMTVHNAAHDTRHASAFPCH